MGRLYRMDGPFGEMPIGRFDSSQVNNTSVFYESNGGIYIKHAVAGGRYIARCDRNGNIRAEGSSSVLARCERGIVYDARNREIARYEGNMYGAAAAVAALMLGLADSSSAQQSGGSVAQQPGGSAQSDDTIGCLGAIFEGIIFLITLPFRLIKLLIRLIWAIVSAPSLSLLGGIFLAILSISITPVFDVFELLGLNIEIFETWAANESIFVPLVNVIPAFFPIVGGIYLPRVCAKSGLPEHSIRKTAFLHNLVFLLVPLYEILYNITNPMLAHIYVMFLILVSPFVTLITIRNIKRKIKKLTPKHKKEKKSKKKKKQQDQESEED